MKCGWLTNRFGIEKSKRRMIAEDIAAAFSLL